MTIFSFFLSKKKNTANIAKERLQIIVSGTRYQNEPNYFPKLKKEIIKLISKYIKLDSKKINIRLDRNKLSSLEFSITLKERK
ncbi:cell division topological specificity factor MinE [Buchnera aphidicola (Neophyllaphis podocarpi)]|uniref:cell division topological specificity factor MinE n=1 Tax=Buchnera aphidicola TaxID=9 RepID=UPI0031B853E2